MLLGTGQMSGSTQGQRVATDDKGVGRQRERGTSLVEFTFVAGLLFLLIFGIIGYGVVLSFKQTLTHAAAEAARRGATTQDDPLTVDNPLTTAIEGDERLEVANNAITEFEGWGRDCADMQTCAVVIHDCNLAPLAANNTTATPDCITATLVYDYAAHPIVPNLPLVAGFMPDTVQTAATSQLSFPGP